MKVILFLIPIAVAIHLCSASFAAEILHEDFTDPAWRHPTEILFGVATYSLMVDGVNGWSVSQGLGLPSGAAIKTRTDVLQYVNSFWENGAQSSGGGNPAGISRSDLPMLIDGDFRFGWRDGFNQRTFWEVKLKDNNGNVAATVRHEGFLANGIGNQVTVNGTVATDTNAYSATAATPAFIAVSWDIPADSVTVSLLDGPNGPERTLGITKTIQNNAGFITTFELTSGNAGNGEGGGIEMVGSILGGTNEFGAGIGNGLVINGTGAPVNTVVPSVDTPVTDAFAATLPSETGTVYELQCTTDPVASNNWMGTGAMVTGNGSYILLFDPTGSSPAKQYRVVSNPR
jgi:hypothetical protein